MLIKEWKDLMTQVGDNQSLLLSLKDSPYYKKFIDEVRKLVCIELLTFYRQILGKPNLQLWTSACIILIIFKEDGCI
jgi:hypothetical protein